MKNHYGSFTDPRDFHEERAERAIAELNAMPEIRERTRLIIGDALQISPKLISGGWFYAVTGDSILMSFDPVAHDTVGLQILNEIQISEGDDSRAEYLAKVAQQWLTRSTELGLGTNDLANIDLAEINLG
jgi:hypothetical protein